MFKFAQFSTQTARASKTVCVVGSSGALGQAVVHTFKEVGWKCIGADIQKSQNIDRMVELGRSTWPEQVAHIREAIKEQGGKVDAVVCTAGSWQGGDIASESLLSSVEAMYNTNLTTAVTAAHIAGLHLNESGILVLTGAAAALGPTPGMIGYGMAKAATHHLVASLAKGGLPEDSSTYAVLPNVIDSPNNRAAMPDADFTSWTPPVDIAKEIVSWAIAEAEARPKSGTMFQPTTVNGKTIWSEHR